MNLIEKYLGEVKYIPAMKYQPDEKIEDHKSAGEEFIKIAKMATNLSALERDVTASIGIYMKKNNKKKVKQLLDKYADKIISNPQMINQVSAWVKNKG